MLTFLFTSTLHAQAPAPPVNFQSQSLIDTLGQDLYLRSGSTGLVLVVVHNKEIAFRGFGETAPDSHQPPTPDSFLRLCSLTKIFTTDLLVHLIQHQPAGSPEPPLSLSTTLEFLLPEAVHVPTPEPSRPITLGDLATHTAGLPRELGPTPRGAAHFTYPSRAQRFRALPTLRLKSTPGTAALYSNLGFDLLGDALEQVSSMTLPYLLGNVTLTPLSMNETTYTPTDAQCARLLQGAHPEGPCTSTVNTAGSSGLYSTPTDMARWLQYLLGGTRDAKGQPATPAQNPAAQAAYLFPANLTSVGGLDHAGDPTGIGLGWIHTPGTNGADLVEKTGGGAGFLTYIAMLPAQHLAIFVAATDGSVETHVNLFRNSNNVLLALAGLPTIPLPPPPPPSAATHLKPGLAQPKAKLTRKAVAAHPKASAPRLRPRQTKPNPRPTHA